MLNIAEQYIELSVVQLSGLLFTDYLYQVIVTETNRYTARCHQKQRKGGLEWLELTTPELKTWLGLVTTTGVVQKKGHLADCW